MHVQAFISQPMAKFCASCSCCRTLPALTVLQEIELALQINIRKSARVGRVKSYDVLYSMHWGGLSDEVGVVVGQCQWGGGKNIYNKKSAKNQQKVTHNNAAMLSSGRGLGDTQS